MARKFGIEIEMAGGTADMQQVARIVSGAGARCVVEHYNHIRRAHWKVVGDGSLHGANAMELVSPPLRGKKGLKQVAKVARALQNAGAAVNNSCGFHVHVDGHDLSCEHLKNIAKLVTIHEEHFKAILPASRHNTRWATWPSQTVPGTDIERRVARIDQCTSTASLLQLWGRDRYRAINFEALSRHNTVEFRMHSGTIDPEKITAWIAICVGLVRRAEVPYSIKTHWDSGRKRNWFDFRHFGGKAHVQYIVKRREHFVAEGSATPAQYGRHGRPALRAAA